MACTTCSQPTLAALATGTTTLGSHAGATKLAPGGKIDALRLASTVRRISIPTAILQPGAMLHASGQRSSAAADEFTGLAVGTASRAAERALRPASRSSSTVREAVSSGGGMSSDPSQTLDDYSAGIAETISGTTTEPTKPSKCAGICPWLVVAGILVAVLYVQGKVS
jgi:hypothetical protein